MISRADELPLEGRCCVEPRANASGLVPGERTDQLVAGLMRFRRLTSIFATSLGAPVAAVSRVIRIATESRFFMLFSPFEQASCEPLCRNYNGEGVLGK